MSADEAAEILSVDGREVRVTHPSKLYFSKQVQVTKLDLVRYYLSVAPGALQGIRDRPIVLKRFVNGAEAEPFYQRALTLTEKRIGSEHPDLIPYLNNLAGIYRHQHRYADAALLYDWALTTMEKLRGPDHMDTAQCRAALAGAYRSQGRYDLAEPLYQQVLTFRNRHLGPDHPDTRNAQQMAAL